MENPKVEKILLKWMTWGTSIFGNRHIVANVMK